ncbi:death-associated protein kinase 1 [Trichonephila clavipes]|nr:death-associated protein kinase 1 [Trichonephila clavipes]
MRDATVLIGWVSSGNARLSRTLPIVNCLYVKACVSLTARHRAYRRELGLLIGEGINGATPSSLKSLVLQSIRTIEAFLSGGNADAEFTPRLSASSVKRLANQRLHLGRNEASDWRDQDGNFVVEALFSAVEEGNIAGLEELFTISHIDPNYCNKHGETAIHIAAGLGHLNVVKFLHSKKANIHALDSHGDSAIYWAARQGHEQVIRYLYEEGVSVDIQNKDHDHIYVISADLSSFSALDAEDLQAPCALSDQNLLPENLVVQLFWTLSGCDTLAPNG